MNDPNPDPPNDSARFGRPRVTDPFHAAFHDRFRGSWDLIVDRLRFYLPLVAPLASSASDRRAVDLGCGRGEWLHLAREAGFAAVGVDADERMVAACRAAGFDAVCGDAVAYLAALPAASQTLITAFHLVEHLPFDTVRDLVRGAHRALRPGGVLILETPNTENLLVAAHGFHLDPTHDAPLPGALLAFVAEQAGFHRTAVLRLRPSFTPAEVELTLLDVIQGVGPDVAIAAQKAGPPTVLGEADPLFDVAPGPAPLDLLSVQKRQTAAAAERIARLERDVQAATSLAASVSDLEADLRATKRIVADLALRVATAEAHLADLIAQRRQPPDDALSQPPPPSTRRTLLRRLAKIARPLLRFVMARPRLRMRLTQILKRHPASFTRIRAVAAALHLLPPDHDASPPSTIVEELEPLTVRQQRLRDALASAIAERQRGSS